MTAESVVILFRPVGQQELDLILASGWREFPPRLEHQPIFYPVLTEEYAIRIARDWNTRDQNSGYVGYVLRYRVRKDYLDQHVPHDAGGREFVEYWIPARAMDEFNRNIIGKIEVVHEFRTESV